MFSKCDEEMENKGIPCDCPIPTGLFSVPTQKITVTDEQIEKIPSALNWFVEASI
jgi:ganglioside GM2 activator